MLGQTRKTKGSVSQTMRCGNNPSWFRLGLYACEKSLFALSEPSSVVPWYPKVPRKAGPHVYSPSQGVALGGVGTSKVLGSGTPLSVRDKLSFGMGGGRMNSVLQKPLQTVCNCNLALFGPEYAWDQTVPCSGNVLTPENITNRGKFVGGGYLKARDK